MHIYEIWERDLDLFLVALDQYEEQEEKDRLTHGVSNGGARKKIGKRAPPKAK